MYMADSIKSALEIALAKAEAASEEITDEDRLRWKYVPEGEKLGARIIKGTVNIEEELEKYDEAARTFLTQGAASILYANILLPRGSAEKEKTSKALDAILLIKNEINRAQQIVEQIRNLFEHYETQGDAQRNTALEQLKDEYTRKLKQAVEQQYGSNTAGMIADVENVPQFKEEKRRLNSQFDNQYLKLLNEYKEELKNTG
jgi:hypothetical protein